MTTVSVGISLAFAKLLVEKGCSILIGDLALTAEAEALVTAHPYDASHAKPFVLFHKTDVTSWPQLSSLWQTALQRFTAVDIVVPGAGVFEPPFSNFWKPPKTETNPDTPSGDLAGAEPGHFATLDINLVAPIRLSQLAIGHWTTTKREGCLVLLGSVAGFITAPNRPLYHVSKHGLHAFVRSLGAMRDELGIRIGAVAPGPVKVSARCPSLFLSCHLQANQVLARPNCGITSRRMSMCLGQTWMMWFAQCMNW